MAAPDGFELLCSLDDLTIGTPERAEVDGVVMAVVRTSEREVHAVDDVCTHGAVSLSEGEVEGCTIECWLHGSRFDLVTGDPLGPPATIPVEVYPVHLDGDDVYVSPDPVRPDSASPDQARQPAAG